MLRGIEFSSKSGNKYLYDDFTGFIFNINHPEDMQEIFERHTSLKSFNCKYSDNEFFNVDDIKYHLYDCAEGFKQLLLEVTSACNFRCKYCTYSEFYDTTRPHGIQMMSFYTAKKSIDYYFENFVLVLERNPFREPIINFYGGEPLLNCGLIKKCVTYVENHYKKYLHENLYYITTNGLLLSDEIQDFLYKNRFSVLISIDGNKENHDRNRVTASGEATFDVVFNNYKKMKAKYPDTKISISACMDYKTDIEDIMNFSNKENIDFTSISFVEASSGSYYEQFSEQDKIQFANKYNKLQSMMFDIVEDSSENKHKNEFLVKYIGRKYKDIVFHRKLGNNRSKVCPYSGTCIMGEKVYVDSHGKFFMCEKIGCRFEFGNVEQGLDFDKIVSVFKKYRDKACSKCKDCNITKLCGLCFKDLDQNFSFTANKDLCELQRQNQKHILEDYVTTMELNPKLFDENTSQYYQKINKKEVSS